MNDKRVLVIGINYSPELTGIGKYTGEMVTWLARQGYGCTVVTAPPYYPDWRVREDYRSLSYRREIFEDGRIDVVRCPLYVPRRPSGARRILHEASFFFSALIAVIGIMFGPRHDFIFCAAPPFHLGLIAIIYRLFRGGRMIYHIQDLQVDAAKELRMIRFQPLLSLMFAIERWILRHADVVSSISNGMIARIAGKTDRDVELFPNWVDTGRFHPVDDRAALKKRYGFGSSDRVVLYSGSIGEKQGLDALLDVARRFRTDRDVRFVICGTGPYKARLIELAAADGLDNVAFLDLQPLETFNEFFNIADVHLVLQKAGAGDLVMPSKLTTILAVGGLAVVTSSPGTTLYDEVSRHELGLIAPPEDAEALFSAISEALRNKSADAFRIRARLYAETRLSDESIFATSLRPMLGETI